MTLGLHLLTTVFLGSARLAGQLTLSSTLETLRAPCPSAPGGISIKCGLSLWPQEQCKSCKENLKKEPGRQGFLLPIHKSLCVTMPSVPWRLSLVWCWTSLLREAGSYSGLSLASLACRTARFPSWKHTAAMWLLPPSSPQQLAFIVSRVHPATLING